MSSVVQFSIFSSHKAFDKTCPDEVTRVTTPVDAESTVAQLKRNLWSLSTRTKCWNGASPFTSCWDSAQVLHFFLHDLHEEGWSKLWQTMRQKNVKRSMAFPGAFKVHKKRMPMAKAAKARGEGRWRSNCFYIVGVWNDSCSSFAIVPHHVPPMFVQRDFQSRGAKVQQLAYCHTYYWSSLTGVFRLTSSSDSSN